MTIKQKVEDYLTGPHKMGGVKYKSPYLGALIDARNTSGWASTVLYLIVIDHIGGVFKRRGTPRRTKKNKTDKEPDFIYALKNFSTLSVREINALYALRCSLVHEYSLSNISKRLGLSHKFQLSEGETPFISLPERPWTGRKVKNETKYTTNINIEKFGKFVEDVHREIYKLHKEDKLIITNKKRLVMIIYR